MNKKNTSGFTLIELLIVIAIIGVLAGLVSVNLQDARVRARDAQRKSDLRAIRNALELYKNDHAQPTYPAVLTDLSDANYMSSEPADPLYRQSPTAWIDYTFTRDPSDTLKYTLIACLENTSDIDKDNPNDGVVCTLGGVSYTLTEP